MNQPTKVDVFKEHKAEYATPKAPAFIQTTPGLYLTVEGQGAPEGQEFQGKIAAIYGVAYTIKFTKKKLTGQNFKIAPLEGLWWVDEDRSRWKWKLLVRVPDFLTERDLASAREELLHKGKGEDTPEVKLETIDEGECVQVLHLGPYENETPTIEALHAFAENKGIVIVGPHHEIYLSDPRRTAPERIKTIIRYAVKETSASRGC
jgi:hypothetical protein